MQQYSVLMSVYIKEHAPFFRTALESMLNQSAAPQEIVLVCDGPLTQQLEAVIAEYQEKYPQLFRLIRLPENRGLGIALQEGLLMCSNELVARMDTDDIALPDRMEKQLKFMEAHPDVAVVGGQISEFCGEPDNIVAYRRLPLTHEEAVKFCRFRNPMSHMTVLLRKSCVMAAGGYQHFLYCEDYYLWVRLIHHGFRLCNIPDICCNVRVNDAFYKRRGNWTFFQNVMKVDQYMLKNGMMSLAEYIRNVIVWFVGVILLPNKIRGFLFKKLLRRQEWSQPGNEEVKL